MPARNSLDARGKRQTIEVNPCTEDGKVTLESVMKDKQNAGGREPYYDPVRMCESLRKTKSFSKVRCSTEIGYAIVEYEDMRIHVFKEGKIIIRRAKDRDDAMKTLQMVSEILAQAVIERI